LIAPGYEGEDVAQSSMLKRLDDRLNTNRRNAQFRRQLHLQSSREAFRAQP